MFRPIVLVLGLAFSPAVTAFAADIEGVEKLFRTGRYDEVARLAGAEIEQGAWNERYSELKIEAELARGKYAEAKETLEDALNRFRASVSLRLLGREVYRYNGRPADAANELDAIEQLVLRAPERFTSPENRLCVGRFFLLRGADARKVLDQFYDVVTKEQPDLRRGATSPRPSWPWTSRITPWPPRRSGRRRRTPPRIPVSTTCWPVPFGRAIARVREGSSPRPSRSTRATSTACCCRPIT